MLEPGAGTQRAAVPFHPLQLQIKHKADRNREEIGYSQGARPTQKWLAASLLG